MSSADRGLERILEMRIEDTAAFLPTSMGMEQKQANIDKEQKQVESFARQLENAQNKKDQDKLYKTCQELESVFVNQILQSMRSTIPKSEFAGHSYATELWESMLYEEYAQEISKTGSLGLADIIFRQLSQKL